MFISPAHKTNLFILFKGTSNQERYLDIMTIIDFAINIQAIAVDVDDVAVLLNGQGMS
jgi:hypothetical protein